MRTDLYISANRAISIFFLSSVSLLHIVQIILEYLYLPSKWNIYQYIVYLSFVFLTMLFILKFIS